MVQHCAGLSARVAQAAYLFELTASQHDQLALPSLCELCQLSRRA